MKAYNFDGNNLAVLQIPSQFHLAVGAEAYSHVVVLVTFQDLKTSFDNHNIYNCNKTNIPFEDVSPAFHYKKDTFHRFSRSSTEKSLKDVICISSYSLQLQKDTANL